MNAAKQAAWIFCTLVALACSGLYFASSAPIVKLDEQTLSQSVDMVVSQLTVKRFDQAGKLIHCLQAPEMHHIPKNNTHLFKTPQIKIVQENQQAWEISSDHARAINGGEQITFIHNVVVHQKPSEKTQASTMKTEQLIYYSKKQLATTQEAVSFQQAGTIAHSKGMNAYLADKRVQLLSKAHATYEPPHA